MVRSSAIQMNFEGMPSVSAKTYRAIRHDVIRTAQRENSDALHHPLEKTKQIERVLSGLSNLHILELFAGQGNLTKLYKQHGVVDAFDQKHLQTGDSFVQFHRLIGEQKTYDVIDLDPYGFPSRFMPDIFLLIEHGNIFITFPKPSVNILNGITQTHLTAYYGQHNPSHDAVIERIANFGICHWRKLELIDSVDLSSVWRFAFKVERVKATEYTGVANR